MDVQVGVVPEELRRAVDRERGVGLAGPDVNERASARGGPPSLLVGLAVDGDLLVGGELVDGERGRFVAAGVLVLRRDEARLDLGDDGAVVAVVGAADDVEARAALPDADHDRDLGGLDPIRDLVGLLVDVDLALLPLVRAEDLLVVLELADGADVVEVVRFVGDVVPEVREELPAFVDRVVRAPVVGELHLLTGLGHLRLDFVADDVDLVLEVDVDLVGDVRRRGREDVRLEALLVLGGNALGAAHTGGESGGGDRGDGGPSEDGDRACAQTHGSFSPRSSNLVRGMGLARKMGPMHAFPGELGPSFAVPRPGPTGRSDSMSLVTTTARSRRAIRTTDAHERAHPPVASLESDDRPCV